MFRRTPAALRNSRSACVRSRRFPNSGSSWSYRITVASKKTKKLLVLAITSKQSATRHTQTQHSMPETLPRPTNVTTLTFSTRPLPSSLSLPKSRSRARNLRTLKQSSLSRLKPESGTSPTRARRRLSRTVQMRKMSWGTPRRQRGRSASSSEVRKTSPG